MAIFSHKKKVEEQKKSVPEQFSIRVEAYKRLIISNQVIFVSQVPGVAAGSDPDARGVFLSTQAQKLEDIFPQSGSGRRWSISTTFGFTTIILILRELPISI